MKKNHEAQVTSFNHRFTQLKWPCEAASWALSVISYSEVIVEMVLSRKTSSNHNKWKWIASLEGIKYVKKNRNALAKERTHCLYLIEPCCGWCCFMVQAKKLSCIPPILFAMLIPYHWMYWKKRNLSYWHWIQEREPRYHS